MLTGDQSPDEHLAVLAGRPQHLVLLDDAHRLRPDAVPPLIAAARAGRLLALARRPTLEPVALADLERAAGADQVEPLAPLDRVAVAGLLSAATGHAAPAELVAAIWHASAGLPVFAVAMARAAADRAERSGPERSGDPSASANRVPAAVLARVQRSLVTAGRDATSVARVLALDPDLEDDALALAAEVPAERLPGAARSLRDAGLLQPGRERLVPLVTAALLAEQTGIERRAGHHRIARARAVVGAAPGTIATALWAARVRTPEAAERYLAAAEAVLWAEPAQAWAWLDRAAEVDADVMAVVPDDPAGADRAVRWAAVRGEAAVLLGNEPPEPAPAAPTALAGQLIEQHARTALVAAVADIQQGRVLRGGTALAGCGPLGAALAAPALVAAGRLDLTAPPRTDAVPIAVARLAEAAIACVSAEPALHLPLLIEAVETAGRTRPAVLWPETPHALTALAAVAAGDATTAEHALSAALAPGAAGELGGPAAGLRHRLLLAWVRLRTGRYDTAVAQLRDESDPWGTLDPTAPVRHRLLRTVLAAGLARRRGDVAAMRALWPQVEPLLARRAVELFGTEPLEELLVVAARLRHLERVQPLLDDLDAIVGRLGRPPVWAAAVGWLHLQVAVATDDGGRAAAVVASLADLLDRGVDPAGRVPSADRCTRAAALAAAAACWAQVLADRVDPDPVLTAVEALAGPGQLPWEASQLAGQAAIRCSDARLTRRLLERARELSNAETAAPAADDGRVGALSEREVEVARLVLAGRTHREIGSQLFISAKTVEHHVARIRTKLGVQTRAEFVAALRALLEDDSPDRGIRSPIGDS
jgi:DNA-binding NarL/FixJ family response regulator